MIAARRGVGFGHRPFARHQASALGTSAGSITMVVARAGLTCLICALASSLASAPPAYAQCSGDTLFDPGGGYSSGSIPRRVIVADLNGDAISDLATANGDGWTISLFFGEGAAGVGN